jgi:hypothetical protein
MQIVYWAHSYREEDAQINRHFGVLIEQSARMIVNFDPPSKSVNEAKLDQNLRSCDGMVAVLTWRATGPSPYILYEIGLSLRARKPLVVFLDDRLSGEILPSRILQQRFSHRTYFRQFREHNQALRAFQTYLGDPPPARYQPNFGQRTCALVGAAALDTDGQKLVYDFVQERGYQLVHLENVDTANPLLFERFEHLANIDVALVFVDSRSHYLSYWAGALNAAALPTITITTNPEYRFSDKFPREFQPRLAHVRTVRTRVCRFPAPGSSFPLEEVLKTEFDLYEQDFLKVEDPDAIERYTKMQVQAGALAGQYETNTRRQFLEVIMGDKYDVSGQAGAVGPHAHAHDMTFTQVWNQLAAKLDLAQLANELQRLREALEREATEPAQKLAAGAVAAAEQSARQKDGPKVIEYLKTAGEWALKVSEKIGVALATAALKGALGMA